MIQYLDAQYNCFVYWLFCFGATGLGPVGNAGGVFYRFRVFPRFEPGNVICLTFFYISNWNWRFTFRIRFQVCVQEVAEVAPPTCIWPRGPKIYVPQRFQHVSNMFPSPCANITRVTWLCLIRFRYVSKALARDISNAFPTGLATLFLRFLVMMLWKLET